MQQTDLQSSYNKRNSPLSCGIVSILIAIFIIASCLKGEKPYDIVSLSACMEAIESYKRMKATKAKVDFVAYVASIAISISALILFLLG